MAQSDKTHESNFDIVKSRYRDYNDGDIVHFSEYVPEWSEDELNALKSQNISILPGLSVYVDFKQGKNLRLKYSSDDALQKSPDKYFYKNPFTLKEGEKISIEYSLRDSQSGPYACIIVDANLQILVVGNPGINKIEYTAGREEEVVYVGMISANRDGIVVAPASSFPKEETILYGVSGENTEIVKVNRDCKLYWKLNGDPDTTEPLTRGAADISIYNGSTWQRSYSITTRVVAGGDPVYICDIQAGYSVQVYSRATYAEYALEVIGVLTDTAYDESAMLVSYNNNLTNWRSEGFSYKNSSSSLLSANVKFRNYSPDGEISIAVGRPKEDYEKKKNSFDDFGAVLIENVPYVEFTAKDPDANKWNDENGEDVYDADDTYFDASNVQFPMCIVGEDEAECNRKFKAMLQYLSTHGLLHDIYCPWNGQSYKACRLVKAAVDEFYRAEGGAHLLLTLEFRVTDPSL